MKINIEQLKLLKKMQIGFDYEDKDECIKAIEIDPENIKYIENPSKRSMC